MNFLLFLRGFIGVLVVFAIASYLITHSFWTAFVQTLVCAVLIQAGYFIAVLFLIRKEKPKPAPKEVGTPEIAAAPVQQANPKGEAASLRSARR
jgi:hypothetical protein